MDEALRQACRRELDNYLATLCANGLLETELKAAAEALEWHATHAPEWAQPLRLTPEACWHQYKGWPDFVASAYSLSLWSRRYKYRSHPAFHEYGCGVTYAVPELRADPYMCELLPPRRLAGLDENLCWRPLR